MLQSFLQFLYDLGYTNEDIRETISGLMALLFIAVAFTILLIHSTIKSIFESKSTNRKLKDTKNSRERKLSGADIQEEFEDLKNELLEMIGDSQLLAPMGRMIKHLVDLHLPQLLLKRKYILKNKPRNNQNNYNKDIAFKLNQRLESIDELISYNKRLFSRLSLVIVDTNSSLSGNNQTIETSMRELSDFSETIQKSVAETVEQDDPLTAANRELDQELQKLQAMNLHHTVEMDNDQTTLAVPKKNRG